MAERQLQNVLLFSNLPLHTSRITGRHPDMNGVHSDFMMPITGRGELLCHISYFLQKIPAQKNRIVFRFKFITTGMNQSVTCAGKPTADLIASGGAWKNVDFVSPVQRAVVEEAEVAEQVVQNQPDYRFIQDDIK